MSDWSVGLFLDKRVAALLACFNMFTEQAYNEREHASAWLFISMSLGFSANDL